MSDAARFDLLTTVDQGGCSAKLPADQLAEVLKALPELRDDRLLVDASTHDDAGVYKLTDELAIIQTVDFFPPLCSDPYEFGQIAAANALSDVYAMGGQPITAMNIVMFPAFGIPLAVLGEILRGGMERVATAGAVMAGGHTIADSPPKYGLSVTGVVHPARVVTNAAARPGDALVLTKPIGTAILLAGPKTGLAAAGDVRAAMNSMKQLNREGAEVMQRHGVRAATDITGFSLLGHARGMARASGVTLRIRAADVPLLPGAFDLADAGCLPGACFRNQTALDADLSFAPGIEIGRAHV
jgi:selenide,water dikinase